MSAIVITAITATKKKAGSQDEETVFQVIVFALDKRRLLPAGFLLVGPTGHDKRFGFNHGRLVYGKVRVFEKFPEEQESD